MQRSGFIKRTVLRQAGSYRDWKRALSFRRKENIKQRGIEEEGFQSHPLGGVRYTPTPHFPAQEAHWLRLPRLTPPPPPLPNYQPRTASRLLIRGRKWYLCSTEDVELSIFCYVDFLIQDLAAEIWTVRNRRFLVRKVDAYLFWNVHTFGWYNQVGTVQQNFPHYARPLVL